MLEKKGFQLPLETLTYCLSMCRQLWNELCEMCSKNPTKVLSLKVDPIIRQGIKRYSDQVGLLWNSLADYYIRSSHFEKVHHLGQSSYRTPYSYEFFNSCYLVYHVFDHQMAGMYKHDASWDQLSICSGFMARKGTFQIEIKNISN